MSDRKKILIIDDEHDYGKMVKINLEDTGAFEVQTESKAMEGVEAAKTFQPDLILLDIVMPDMTGPAVATQLKEDQQTKDIPIAFLTATVTKEEQQSSKTGTIGEYPFIAKPVGTQELIKFINSII